MVHFKELIKKLFPHASQDFLKKNPDLESRLQDSKSKPVCVQPLDQVLQGKEKSHASAYLSITSFTVKLKDEDNLKGGCKALIDCLKALRLIDDDDPKSLKLKVTQKKVMHRNEERTQVKITYDMENRPKLDS